MQQTFCHLAGLRKKLTAHLSSDQWRHRRGSQGCCGSCLEEDFGNAEVKRFARVFDSKLRVGSSEIDILEGFTESSSSLLMTLKKVVYESISKTTVDSV